MNDSECEKYMEIMKSSEPMSEDEIEGLALAQQSGMTFDAYIVKMKAERVKNKEVSESDKKSESE